MHCSYSKQHQTSHWHTDMKLAKTSEIETLFLVCSLFGRRSKELPAASTAAAAPIVPESPRSQPSFEAERAQYAEDIASLTAEKAKQQASTHVSPGRSAWRNSLLCSQDMPFHGESLQIHSL